MDENGNDVTSACKVYPEAGSLTVLPYPVSFTTSGGTYDYGADIPFSVSCTGNGTSLSGTTTESGYDYFATYKLVGDDSIEFAIGPIPQRGDDADTYYLDVAYSLHGNAGNYNVVVNNGTDGSITIKPYAITLTASDYTKTYDGYPCPKTTDWSYTTHDELSIGYRELGSDEWAAGTYTNTLEIDYGSHKEENFNITIIPGTLTINKRDVTITSASVESKYDGTEQKCEEFTITEGSFLDVDGFSVAFTGSRKDAGSSENAFTVNAVGYTDLNNYNIKTVFGTLKVNPRDVTLTSASDSKVYDGSPLKNSEVTVGGDGFVSGEGATYSVTGEQTEVGSSANTFTYTLNEGTNASNYNITKTEGTLEVTKQAVTINTGDRSKAYDGSPFTFDGTEYTVESAPGLKYTLKGASITDAGQTASNDINITAGADLYDITVNPGTLSIEKRNVTITSDNGSKTYNASPLTKHSVTVSGDGFAPGEGATYEFSGTITDPGSTPNTFTYTLNSNTKAGNYNITTAEGTLSISKVLINMYVGNHTQDAASFSGYAIFSSITAKVAGGEHDGDSANITIGDNDYDHAKLNCQVDLTPSGASSTLFANFTIDVSIYHDSDFPAPGTYNIVAEPSGGGGYLQFQQINGVLTLN